MRVVNSFISCHAVHFSCRPWAELYSSICLDTQWLKTTEKVSFRYEYEKPKIFFGAKNILIAIIFAFFKKIFFHIISLSSFGIFYYHLSLTCSSRSRRRRKRILCVTKFHTGNTCKSQMEEEHEKGSFMISPTKTYIPKG